MISVSKQLKDRCLKCAYFRLDIKEFSSQYINECAQNHLIVISCEKLALCNRINHDTH